MNSMTRFTVMLRNEKKTTYTRISWLIVILNFVFFVYVGLNSPASVSWKALTAAGSLIIIYILKRLKLVRDREDILVSLAYSFIIVSWIILSFYWAAAINTVLFVLQDITRRKLAVLFFDDRVIYPSFPRRTIFWKELNNVIIKDDFLTIDLRNDKVFQHEILPFAYENELNQFCNEQIRAALKN